MKWPTEVYQPFSRPYRGLPDIDYPFHEKIIVVTNCGRICLGRKKLTSARSLPARRSASKKCTMISGWLALWITTWDILILKRGCWNRSTTHSPQVVTHVAGTLCNPCLRVAP
jgi:hypothetical protein